MLQIHKALVLWRHFFDYDAIEWECQFQDGIHKAVLQDVRWRVEVWGKPEPSFSHLSLTYDPQAFFYPCKYLSHAHTLDLWIRGLGRVMSVEWDGRDLVPVGFDPGDWESRIFGLPEEEFTLASERGRPVFSTLPHAA